MNIVITGSSGCLAQALLPVLCEQPFVDAVTGVDWKPSKFTHPKFRHVPLDIRDAGLATVIANHDAVVHLAFVVAQEQFTTEEMRSVNIDGSENVVNCAAAHGVTKFVNMSSVSVYGAGEGMTESRIPIPPSWFPYAQQKADLERYIEKNMASAIQFRAHLIVGKRARRFLRAIFRLPVWLDFGKCIPKQQVVHEDDVVDAIIAGLQQDVSGYYNLAAPEVISLGGDYIRKGEEEGRKLRRLSFR